MVTTTKSKTTSETGVHDLLEQVGGNPSTLRLPRGLVRSSARALDALKKKFVGVDAGNLDGFCDALFYQAYLDRGLRLLAQQHQEALRGRLDRTQLHLLCARLQAVVSMCEQNINAEHHAVRSLKYSAMAEVSGVEKQ